jgi:MFS transporter, PAT family, beta-lactamase induction signal transducer AmpG
MTLGFGMKFSRRYIPKWVAIYGSN